MRASVVHGARTRASLMFRSSESEYVAEGYRLGTGRRLANLVISALVRFGLPAGGSALLTTRGRKSGKPRTTPVKPIPLDGHEWIVAPDGARPWVLNVRANGEASLRRGRQIRRVALVEADAAAAAPVLKHYLETTAIVAPFFEASPTDPPDAFLAEAASHPVFRVDPA